MAGNRKYQRGVAWERAIQQALEAQGYVTFRSAGSHGVADVVALHPLRRDVRLIQAKTGTGRASAADRAALARLRGYYAVWPEIHTKRLRQEPLIEQL